MRHVTTASAPAAASRGDVAKRAPAFVRPSALLGVRLKTASENPALRMFCAIPIPIRPRPMNPTFSTPFVIAVLRFDAPSRHTYIRPPLGRAIRHDHEQVVVAT